MKHYHFTKLTDYSIHQMDQIRRLEQLCKDYDESSLRVGVESIKEQGGDEAFLCSLDDQLIGFLSWYTSDGTEANINAMVHPAYRRQGIFRNLLNNAVVEMNIKGITTCRIRVPSNSKPGMDYLNHIGASFSSSQFTMYFVLPPSHEATNSGLVLRPVEAHDFDFMVKCSSQAFGDSEVWTRNYFKNTNEPERHTYIAMDGLSPIGMIRVNHLQDDTAVIHDFCVIPSCQGRGYGREILVRLVNSLLTRDYSRIRLSVVTKNRRALTLYQSVGFEVTAESNYYVRKIDDIV
ncbi:acetyltransferase [Paenibacillus albidus]|uniref:Acetyltransferase n=1 Tax=Paenibacillus albidus TaxID=2041023 RepID=A0A917FNC1_9BACL|nr:GNAT family N-acetyltransferase [Paenibacillus albidus]GGF92655.1 acetyltransferase [Paenibacillus albidus]